MSYLYTNMHAGTYAETCPNPETDELEMDPCTPSVYSQVATVIWPGFSVMCVRWSVCVCVYFVAPYRWQAAGTGAGQ